MNGKKERKKERGKRRKERKALEIVIKREREYECPCMRDRLRVSETRAQFHQHIYAKLLRS